MPLSPQSTPHPPLPPIPYLETPPHDHSVYSRDKAFLTRSFLSDKLRSKDAKVEVEVVENEGSRAEEMGWGLLIAHCSFREWEVERPFGVREKEELLSGDLTIARLRSGNPFGFRPPMSNVKCEMNNPGQVCNPSSSPLPRWSLTKALSSLRSDPSSPLLNGKRRRSYSLCR